MNRGNDRRRLFDDDVDYIALLMDVEEAARATNMRILAYCIMPNHWHFLLWPREDGDVARFVARLTRVHTQRWHRQRGTVGTGHIYQARYKSFPVATDDHLLAVCRYIERNPLRANLVADATQWPWSSLRARAGLPRLDYCLTLADLPVPIPACWTDLVAEPQTEAELTALREAVKRGTPFGTEEWRDRAAAELGLEATVRPRGRPRAEPDPTNGARTGERRSTTRRGRRRRAVGAAEPSLF